MMFPISRLNFAQLNIANNLTPGISQDSRFSQDIKALLLPASYQQISRILLEEKQLRIEATGR